MWYNMGYLSEGVQVLEAYKYHAYDEAGVLIILSLIFMVLLLQCISNRDVLYGLIFLFMVLLLGSTGFSRMNDYTIRYRVRIDETVSYLDFLDRYKEIERVSDDIFIVEKIEENYCIEI